MSQNAGIRPSLQTVCGDFHSSEKNAIIVQCKTFAKNTNHALICHIRCEQLIAPG